MSREGLGRRAFLRSAGLSALAGAVTTGSAAAAPILGPIVGLDGETPGAKVDFDALQERLGIDSTKWDEQYRRFGGKDKVDVGMGIADMDFKSAPCIHKALSERLQRDNWGYVTIPPSYFETIAAFNKRRYGLEIDPKTIMTSNAVHPSIIATLRAFSPPGNRVLMFAPIYNGFYGDIRAVNNTPADVPMKLANGRYSMDFEALERAISYDTPTLILCNPQNPTGNVWSKQDLLTLGEICLKHRVLVLADEVHCDFINKGAKYTPFASLPNEAVVRNSVTFKSAAKSFNLAGMAVAYLFTNNKDVADKIKVWHRQGISTPGMVAQTAAYTEGDAWLDQLVAYNDANLTFVDEYTRKNVPLIKSVKPEGTYLGWVDVSAVMAKIGAVAKAEEATKAGTPTTPTQVMERWFVEHAKVQMNPGATFGTGGEARMRMNCATSRKMLELALSNLATATRNL